MFSLKTKILLSSLLLVLSSCNLYNHYSPPCVDAPDEWKNTTVCIEPPEVDHWWEVFDDTVLNCLEKQAVENNRDIEIAYFRMKEVYAESRVAFAQLFPSITFDPNYSRENQFSSFVGFPGLSSTHIDNSAYTLPLDGQYNADLWNQYGLGYRSARERAQASYQEWQNVLLQITAQVVENYYSLRTADSELEVLERNMRIRSDQVDITRSRFNAGLVNYTDVSRALTELSNIRADYENTLRLRATFENNLAVLTGQAAPYFHLARNTLLDKPPAIPASFPCAVIQQRPDVREAERLVAAAHDDIGVAWTSFLPALTLTGTIGYSNPSFHDLLAWKSRLWAYAFNISQVVFDGGAIIANYQAKKAIFFQSISGYYQQVLIAFKEVENALADIEYRSKQEKELDLSVQTSKETLNLVQIRYERGLVDYLDVVDAERTYLEAERAEVIARGAQFVATGSLIKALGGIHK